MSDGDQGDTESSAVGAQVTTRPLDDTTPLLPPNRAAPPTYQATETDLARLPPGGQGNEVGERRGRAAVRVHVGHRSRSDRRTPASSATARPTRAPVSSAQTRPAQAAAVCTVQTRLVRVPAATPSRPARRRARYKPAIYISLFIIGVLIAAADLFIGLWRTIVDNDDSDDHDEIAKPVYFLLMGGSEAIFILWHTCILASFLCCRTPANYYRQVIYWLLRIFHLGAFLLLGMVVDVGLTVWPSLPNLFQWTVPILLLYLSMMSKYITLIYWAVELTVDFCKSLDW